MKSIKEIIMYLVIIFLFGLFQAWRADFDIRCFFASDASTCAEVRNARK